MRKLSRIMACVLTAAMLLSCGFGAMAATTSDEVTQREIDSAAASQYIATQGMVLLENEEGALPIADGGKIALFGGGAYNTIKGGTGSGSVNQRDYTTVWEGFEAAGYEITSLDYLEAYKAYYDANGNSSASGGMMFGSGVKLDDIVIDDYIDAALAAGSDTALYVISRNSGEGADRTADALDYYLGAMERENLEKVAKAFETTIVILNVGGIIDTKFYDEIEELDAMLLMSQAGQQSGDAVVQVLNGEYTPSGKLTDTWAVNYEDYPTSAHFAYNDGDALHEVYDEDIYIGYRYFDTFGVDVAYEFGYGLSYTDFAIAVDEVKADADTVEVTVTVTNTGDTYAGKEVVQIYFSAPGGELEVPYQELVAFGKTDELAPGQSQTLSVAYNTTEMSSYSMERAAYILQAGDYVIRVGNSSRNTEVAAVLSLDELVVTEQLSNQVEQDQEIDTLSNADAKPISYAEEEAQIASAPHILLQAGDFETVNNASVYDDEAIVSYVTPDSDYQIIDQQANPRYTKQASTFESSLLSGYEETLEVVQALDNAMLVDVATGKITMEEFVANLTAEEMCYIVMGGGMSMSSSEPIIGAQSYSVSGAAGETTSNYFESHGIPNIVLADGPAGVRINQSYTSDGETYYQFCTAFPIGTMIAQTWDTDIMYSFGDCIGTEMEEMGVTLWLAPGMNIHTNPLCGRNFEYYSEDPLVAGIAAATTTLGVQSHDGIGTTVKHYAANSQESNRNSENNSITERAFREIYLKGFEIAVKMAQPMAIMTCYNVNNSMPGADDYDLCTDIPRGEWGFEGLIMTDWGGGQSTPVNSMHAGNDLIMPGGSGASLYAQYESGILCLGDLQKSAANVLNIIMQSAQFEMLTGIQAEPYSQKFELQDYITVTKSGQDAPAASAEPSGEPSGEISGSPAPAGGTDEAAYQAYLIEFVASCEDIQSSGSAAEYIALIEQGDYASFPVEMLFNAQWFGEAALTYDEFVAAGGNVVVAEHPSNGAMLDGTGG